MSDPATAAAVVRTDPVVRPARGALAGVGVFVLVAVIVQCLRPDLHWLDDPLSYYLIGPYSPWLQAAYAVLAVAMVLLGAAGWRAGAGCPRSAAPWLLFGLAGVALVVTALARSALPGQPFTAENLIHGIAAKASFLCASVAMLLQAWWLRHAPGWRRRFPGALTLAWLCFAGLWLAALWHGLPPGLEQRLLIGLMLAWLALAANALRGWHNP